MPPVASIRPASRGSPLDKLDPGTLGAGLDVQQLHVDFERGAPRHLTNAPVTVRLCFSGGGIGRGVGGRLHRKRGWECPVQTSGDLEASKVYPCAVPSCRNGRPVTYGSSLSTSWYNNGITNTHQAGRHDELALAAHPHASHPQVQTPQGPASAPRAHIKPQGIAASHPQPLAVWRVCREVGAMCVGDSPPAAGLSHCSLHKRFRTPDPHKDTEDAPAGDEGDATPPVSWEGMGR